MIPWFIGFGFCFIIAVWIAYGFIAYYAVTHVSKDGLSGVAQKVWCGEKPNCKLPFGE
jgi:hypothetical protein